MLSYQNLSKNIFKPIIKNKYEKLYSKWLTPPNKPIQNINKLNKIANTLSSISYIFFIFNLKNN